MARATPETSAAARIRGGKGRKPSTPPMLALNPILEKFVSFYYRSLQKLPARPTGVKEIANLVLQQCLIHGHSYCIAFLGTREVEKSKDHRVIISSWIVSLL